MNVTVQLFAGLKELVGGQEITLQMPDGATLSDLEQRLTADYPRLKLVLPGLAFAVGEEYRTRDFTLHDDDEVALIPPISGGAALFEVTEDALDPASVIAAVAEPANGAIVLFLGAVRSDNEGRKVRHLEYEAYRPMAEKEMRRVGDEVLARWPTVRLAMRHRVGRLLVGETALVVAASAPHRKEAFEACAYSIDRIKEIVPIWKKETWEDGEAWLGGHSVETIDT
jgi:molybdopterin synthase catalytic subunit/molybdopterin converting factor small subunit